MTEFCQSVLLHPGFLQKLPVTAADFDAILHILHAAVIIILSILYDQYGVKNIIIIFKIL